MRLDICLATYNGAPWIKDFLNSLDVQTYADWRLIVSDDGSRDGTFELIKDHFAQNSEKLLVVRRDQTGLGVIKNFQDAIDASNAEYVLLADQDDVWQPNKLELLYQTMRGVEQVQDTPALVFSDLEVVDEQLHLLNASWWSFSAADPAWATSFRGLICQNVVPGCAMMLNRSLIDLALPFPSEILMHDWWLLLVCAAFGKVGFYHDPLVRYRRHADAQTYWGEMGPISRLSRYLSGGYVGHSKKIRDTYERTVLQAQTFVNLYGDRFEALQGGGSMRKLLDTYILSSDKGWWQRRWLLMTNRFRCATLMETAKFYMSI